jgi:hypothetical protein
MAPRLTLDRTGMKSPLDVGENAGTGGDVDGEVTAPERAEPDGTTETAAIKPTPKRSVRQRGGASAPAASPSDTAGASPEVAMGRDGAAVRRAESYAIQTAIVFDGQLVEDSTSLAARAGISFTALLTAILADALPDQPQEVGETALLERLDHPEAVRTGRNIRLPRDLRDRLDALAAPHERIVSGARSLLINAILRANLPETPDQASDLSRAYSRRQALAALRNASS